MTSDLDLEQRQQEFEDEQREQMAREAATLVVEGTDRASAIEMVKNIYREQAGATENELIRDDDGFPEYLLPEAQQPELPTDLKKLAQVKAIAKELIDHFD
ncbi:hypothetical protein [Pseudomonas asiatica]|uniref:hypothetical protein n=1 Tax=Pseudomonas asiatica TaxID=2219225 RepID=UPI0025A3F17C|nr:hypothetical protein [Pseudomonas asiatica]WJN48609.1 hypothetical protein QUR91_18395 [Pseudomonas asiatica]